ncbi:MAG: hypothetical protein JXR77_10430 [Lentisphaeria bacterium]|nr:hypothetical protein [Lentisphaeria bacterium]
MLFGASVLAAAGTAWGQEAALEGAGGRVAVREGRLVSLLDRTRSLEHVASAADALPGLFHVQLVRGVQPAGEIDATSMAVWREASTDRELALAFDHPQVAARVVVRAGERPGETVWSIAVRPKDPALAIGRVDFPVVATPRLVGGEEKRYLFPMFEGKAPLLSNRPYWRAHPSHLFAQMIACLGSTGSFVLWTDDGEGHVKAFGYESRDRHAVFAVRHQPSFEPGREWAAPYRVRLSFCDGSWQGAAEVYRAWASAQPWSATPLRERKDVPELLRTPPLCLSTQLDREDLQTLPARLRAWGERFGAPIIYRPLGWEKHGNWVGIDYFPPALGADAFRDLTARLQERGIVVAGFISGYRWTTRQEGALGQRSNEALARFFAENDGTAICERGRDGALLAAHAEGRESCRVCRGTPFGRTYLQDTARQLFDLGVTVIHDDQDHGPYPDGVESCFDPGHGHPVPCGPWSTAVTREALQAIRAEAARRGVKGFLLTKESCTDLLNGELHAYQARLFHEDTNPDLVPLCQYLFHEHIPIIFGWVTAQNRSPWQLAAMLVYGQVPSLAFWGGTAETPDAIPAASRGLLEDYYAAMAAHAKPFLLYGRMRRPLLADVPTSRREISQVRQRRLARPQTVSVPLVIQSAWDDGSGSVGVFAVNTQSEATVLDLVAPGEHPFRAAGFVGAEPDGADARDLPAGGRLEWRLPPERLCSVVFTVR